MSDTRTVGFRQVDFDVDFFNLDSFRRSFRTGGGTGLGTSFGHINISSLPLFEPVELDDQIIFEDFPDLIPLLEILGIRIVYKTGVKSDKPQR